MMSEVSRLNRKFPLLNPRNLCHMHLSQVVPHPVRHVPGATSTPRMSVPLPKLASGGFSDERSDVQVGQYSEKKYVSVGLMVTTAGPTGDSPAKTSCTLGPCRSQWQKPVGFPERVRYVPGAMSTPTTSLPLPKVANGLGVGAFVGTAVGGGAWSGLKTTDAVGDGAAESAGVGEAIGVAVFVGRGIGVTVCVDAGSVAGAGVTDVAIDGSEAVGLPVTEHAEQSRTAIRSQRIFSHKRNALCELRGSTVARHAQACSVGADAASAQRAAGLRRSFQYFRSFATFGAATNWM